MPVGERTVVEMRAEVPVRHVDAKLEPLAGGISIILPQVIHPAMVFVLKKFFDQIPRDLFWLTTVTVLAEAGVKSGAEWALAEGGDAGGPRDGAR